MRSLMERFEDSYMPEPMSGCWLWLKGLTGKGYGAIKVDGRQLMATRVSWTLYRGHLPSSLFMCHHCDNPACVNPDHLYPGTALDNIRDAIRRKRFKFPNRPPWAGTKAHCKRGHDLSKYGRYTPGTGWKCRECNRLVGRARKAGMKVADWEIEQEDAAAEAVSLEGMAA